jgi:hypothetical protein
MRSVGAVGAFGTAASSIHGAEVSIMVGAEKIGGIGSFCMFTTILLGKRQAFAAR